MATWDTTQLLRLGDDLARAGGDVQRDARRAVQASADAIKKQAQSLASGIGHAPYYAGSITYETAGGPRPHAEIGPDKSRAQGPLGNILEYGTSKNAPIPHLGPALDAENPRFVDAISDLASGVLQ